MFEPSTRRLPARVVALAQHQPERRALRARRVTVSSILVLPLLVTSHLRRAPSGGRHLRDRRRQRRPLGRARIGAPPASEPSTSPSTSTPVVDARRSTAPRGRRGRARDVVSAAAEQQLRGRSRCPASASAVDARRASTPTSARRRPEEADPAPRGQRRRHRRRAARRAGPPRRARPASRSAGARGSSRVSTGRTRVTVTLTSAPVSGANDTGTATGASPTVPSVIAGSVDRARLPAGVDPHLRRHRVLAVGDDLQVEVVERHRRAASPRRPTAPPARRTRCSTRSTGSPSNADDPRAAMSAGRCCDDVTVMPPARHARGCRAPSRARRRVRRLRAGRCRRTPNDRASGTRKRRTSATSSSRVARRHHDVARPAHLVHERTVGGLLARGVDQVGRHAHDLVGAHVLGSGRVVAAGGSRRSPTLLNVRLRGARRPRWCRRA